MLRGNGEGKVPYSLGVHLVYEYGEHVVFAVQLVRFAILPFKGVDLACLDAGYFFALEGNELGNFIGKDIAVQRVCGAAAERRGRKCKVVEGKVVKVGVAVFLIVPDAHGTYVSLFERPFAELIFRLAGGSFFLHLLVLAVVFKIEDIYFVDILFYVLFGDGIVCKHIVAVFRIFKYNKVL